MANILVDKPGLTRFWSNAKDYIDDNDDAKQDLLVSGTNIKTINGTSLLGSGELEVATYSTTDLTAGTSPLATGRIYLVYE